MKDTKQIKEELIKAIETIFEEQKPEFKAGQWAGFKINDGIKSIFYIDKIKGGKVYGDEFKGEGVEWQCDITELISVTPAKIESNLRNICDEKYIGKKARCLEFFDDVEIITSFDRYDEDDSLIYRSKGTCMVVYKQGKFAEIISDKKKLPKTREEFIEFINEWDSKVFDDITINNFLNQYED